MIYDVLELLMNYMQYLFLTVSIDPDAFPSLYSTPFRFLDVIMSALSPSSLVQNTSSSSLNESDSVTLPEGVVTPPLGIHLPSWTPFDLRLRFALINMLCPLALVLLAALGLGPPLFTVFVFLLLMVVFVTVVGSLLLVLTHMYPPVPWTEMWKFRHTITSRGAIVITSAGTVTVMLLLTLGLTVRLVQRRRQRARVLEQLRLMENTPQTLEEGVVEQVMRAGSNEGDSLRDHNDNGYHSSYNHENANGGAEEWGPDQVRCAKTELAYQRIQRQRYRDTRAFSLFWTVLKIGVAAICAGIPLFIARGKSTGTLNLFQSGPVYFSVVAVMFALVVLLIISAILGLTLAGRQRLYDIKLWLQHLLICVGLLVVSFMYTPILRNAINLFSYRTMCEEHVVFTNTGNHGSNSSNILYGLSVLTAGPQVPCASVNALLTASAIVMGVTYVLFFVLLYALITWRALEALEQYPLVPTSGAATAQDARITNCNVGGAVRESTVERSLFAQTHECGSFKRKNNKPILRKYYERVRLSENAARFLYSPYTYYFRYFKLLVLGQKTVMVVLSTVMRAGTGVAPPWTGFTACLLLHTGVTIVLILCKPYAASLEFVVSLALQAVLIIVAAMGLGAALASARVPVEVSSLVTVSLFLVPCVAVVFGVVLTIRERTEWSFSFSNIWKRCLSSKLMSVQSSWYERYEQDSSGDNKALFIPALFFREYNKNLDVVVRIKRSSAVFNSSQPQGQRKEFHAESPEPVDTPLEDTVIMTNSQPILLTAQNLTEPMQSTSSQRERAQHNWSTLRTAVLSGQFTRICPRFSVSRRNAELSLWRAPSTSFSTPHFTQENDPHHVAITALLTSVVNASRWETTGPTRRVAEGDVTPLKCLLSSPNLPRRHVRRQEVFLERVQTILARQRLLTLYSSRKRHIHQQQRAVDCLINSQMASTMRHLFLFLGVSTSVAAALFLSAMLQAE